jgi:hypothetical protein
MPNLRLNWLSKAIIVGGVAVSALEWKRLASADIPSSVRELRLLEARTGERNSWSHGQREIHGDLLALVASVARFVDGPLRRSRAGLQAGWDLEIGRLAERAAGSSGIEDYAFLQLGTLSLDLGRVDEMELELRELCSLATSVGSGPSGNTGDVGRPMRALNATGKETLITLEWLRELDRPWIGWLDFEAELATAFDALQVLGQRGEYPHSSAPFFPPLTLGETQLCFLGERVFQSRSERP